MPSSWDGESHKGPHFTLTIFPNGKLVLTTPDTISPRDNERIHGHLQRWLRSTDETDALVIGDCLVHMVPVSPREVIVVEGTS